MGSTMHASREERDAAICRLFETTDLTQQAIADELGLPRFAVEKTVQRSFSPDFRRERKRESYRRSKLGENNPMTGKTGSDHHNCKGEVADGKGYVMVLKPEWFTGRKGSKHVFKHTVVVCEALGLTELPKGWAVHHVDGDKTNNDLNNLALLTNGAHTRLHQLERATTIPRGSRGLVALEAQSDRRDAA